MEPYSEHDPKLEEVAFDIPVNGVKLSDDRGVYKIILNEGTSKEKPPSGSKVTVHYTGKLVDGTVFDSSYNHGQKFSFNVGRSEVIKGWDLCVASMKKGEKCQVHCAPKYAYGSRGSPPKIPPNAVLIFEIELFDWEGEDLSPNNDKGIIREILHEGEDYTTPNEGAKVNVHVVGWYKGKEFFNKKLKYNVCEGDPELLLPSAIDIALQRMKRKEKSRIRVKPKYGFGSGGCELLNIPADAELVYELTLEEFEKAKEAWEMTDKERIEQSNFVKEEGTQFLKENNVKKAIIKYKKILDYLEYHDAKEDGDDEEKEILEQSRKLKLAACLNLAHCYNKVGEFAEALSKCEQAIEIDPNNEKALFRAGVALKEQRVFDQAKSYFKKTADVNTNNKEAWRWFKYCVDQIKKQSEDEKTRYRGMFDKFSKEDAEAEVRKKVTQQKERAKVKAEKREGKGDEQS